MTEPTEQATTTNAALLRRLVLGERDGFSQGIVTTLRAMGYPGVAWARVEGPRLTCFIGGNGEPPIPDIGERLVTEVGGHVVPEVTPGDRYWLWAWSAPLD